MDAEFDYAKWHEERLAETYGPPEKRAKEERRYIARLMREHSEPLIREILVGLSQLDDFIPAHDLLEADLQQAPLNALLRVCDIPWFYFESIKQRDDGCVEVEVSHCINLAARGETFVFKREGNTLIFVERGERWIS